MLTTIFTGANSFGYYYINKTYKIVDNISKDKIIYTTNLISLDKNIEIKTIGLINNEEDIEGYILPQEYMANKGMKVKITEYDSYEKLLDALYNKEVDAIFIDGNYVLKYNNIEKYTNIANDTFIIDSYSKQMKNQDTVASTNKSVTEPFTVLLLGVDSEYDGLSNNAAFNGDSIMLITFNPKTLSATIFSIPRDTYVSVAGHGKTKINHAYAYGKEQLALKTINSNFGLNISEYVTINFKGLINVINKIGGIELNISKAEKDYINEFVHESYELTRKPVQLLSSYGKVKLTGEQALTHSRNRTIGNDFTREERQRDVLTAVMNKVSTMSITQLWSLSDSVLSEVKTNLNVSECMGIASDVLGNTSSYLNNIVSKQIPSEDDGGKGDNINGIYYYVCDLQKASKSMKNIIYGE